MSVGKAGDRWTERYDTLPYRGCFQQDMVAVLCPRCGGTGRGAPGEKYYEMGVGTFGCSNCNSFGWTPEKDGPERPDIEETARDPRVPASALETLNDKPQPGGRAMSVFRRNPNLSP